MTQIDEKALEAVKDALGQIHNPWLEKGMRAIITAYLSALPPTGDVGELVKQLQNPPSWLVVSPQDIMKEAADALTAANARIAELERERDAAYQTAQANLRQWGDANARAEREARKVLAKVKEKGK